MEVKEWMDPDFWNERTKDLRNKEKWHKRQNVSNLIKVEVTCRFGFFFIFVLANSRLKWFSEYPGHTFPVCSKINQKSKFKFLNI